MGGKPDSDSLHSPSCHQRLWTSHQGQFLATSWKDAGKWQDHPCSKDLTGSISLQGCSLWYKGESCTLLTTGTEHGWEGKPKKHLPLICSQIAPHGCCKGAGGKYYSPTKAVLESGASLWLVVSTAWGKRVSFWEGNGWWDPYSFPVALCCLHIDMCVCVGEEGGETSPLMLDSYL